MRKSSIGRSHQRLITTAAGVWVLASVFTLAGGCSSGRAGRDGSALDSYVKGVMAYQKGDTDKAVASLQEAVAKKDDLVMARSMLGDLYRARSDYDSAREQYEVVARLDPYEFQNHYRLGLVYQLLERFHEAAVSYIKALDLKPTDAPSNMSLGTVYYALSFREPNPKSPEAKSLRDRAVNYAKRATELDPSSATAWVHYAMTLDATRDYAKAEGAYRKAIDLDSANPVTRLYLGENLLSQKKYGEARSVFVELARLQDTPLHRKRLGDAHVGEGNYAEALNQYQAALRLDVNYYPALNDIGRVYIAQYDKGNELDDSKRKAAIEVWQQSLAINRVQPQVMGWVQQYSKKTLFQP